MSDETIQYITTDYLIEVDGGEPAPAPIEYIVELGQVGVQGIPGEKGEPGFSPTVGYILSDDTFRINITNQDGVTQTPNLYDYFASQSDLNGYLKVDGSNADQDITINQAEFTSLSNNAGVRIQKYNGGALQLDTTSSYLTAGGSRPLTLTGGGKSILLSDKAYYDNKQIATIGDIGNGTITLTQGGVTKGTFTTNQSGNTTIDLDAGGGSITNPLEIEDTDSNNFISIGVDSSGANIRLGNTQGLSFNSYLIGNATAPLELTNGAFGDKIIKLNIDSDTLGVNSDNELYVVGGSGTTYTAGTGIDITGNVISIDTDVVAQLSDIPDTTYMVTTNTAQTISGSKTFSSETHHLGVITFDSAMLNPIIRGMSGANYRNMIYRMGNDSAIIVGNSNDTIDLKGSGTRPTYNSNNLALYSDIPSLVGYIQNTATGSASLTISGVSSTGAYATNVGYNSEATAAGQAFGHYAKASGSYSLALGQGATASNSYGIQLGKGTNLTANTLSVGFGSTGNYELLDGTTGLIPDARISSNIARTSAIPDISNLISNTDLATTSTAGIVQPDGSTITVNNGVVKTEGVVNQQDSTTILKYWTGTKAQYDAIATKDSNTLYNVTDDTLNLNNVANIDLSNIASTGKINITHNAMPSSTSTNLTVGADGATYTVPADGYIYASGSGSNYRIGIVIDGRYYGGSWTTTSDIEILIPISKGKQFQFYYTNTTPGLAFIYAVGSESEAS